MSYDTINHWLSRIDKDIKEERDAAMQNLYLQCYTYDEIADRTGTPKTTVQDLCMEIGKYKIPYIPGQFAETEEGKTDKQKKEAEARRLAKVVEHNTSGAEHESDFDAPLYNVWKQQNKTNEVGHFGNTVVAWVDNQLYLYTKPFDVVVAPFGGGRSTIDVCKKRFRCYWVSDRKVEPENEGRIREHGLTTFKRIFFAVDCGVREPIEYSVCR